MNATALRYLPALGRLLIAILFIMSGFSKLGSPSGVQGYIAAAGLPAPLLAYIIAVLVEVVGGILLVVGYQTRIVALIMAVFTFAAALGFHANFADQNQMIHFMKNIAIVGGLLQVVAFGAGALSIDEYRRSPTALNAAR